MSATSILNTCALLVSSRVAIEKSFIPYVRDLQTPSRLAALVHGILCSVALWEGQWLEAIQSTGLFFLVDGVMNGKRLTWDTTLHHLLGMALCLFSTVTGSFETGHFGSELTRALILMEVSNPLLHLLVTLRKEKLEHKLPRLALQLMQGIFLLQFAGIRIGLLGHALYNLTYILEKATDFELSMYWISLSMWILQWIWCIKLVKARTK